MEKNDKNNTIIAVVFLIYIFLTCIYTIKNNYLELSGDLKTAIKEEQDLKIIDRAINLRDKVESVFSNKIALKYDYIDIYGLFQKCLGKRVIEDAGEGSTVIRLSDGSLTFIYPDKDVTNWVNAVTLANDYAKEKGIYFSFVMAPWRINENAELPFYLDDYANEVSHRLLNELEKNNVDVIDLEKSLEINKKKWFFNSDHHWTISAAFNSYQIIAKKLNEKIDINLNKNKLEDFTIEKYPNSFLGSYGKRTGKYYSKVDTFEYIYPNFTTDLQVSNNDWDKEVSNLSGPFENTLVYKDYLNLNADTGRETSVYYTYTNGGKAIVRINNRLAPNNKKLLVLKDSFAEPVFAFLSLNFAETRAVDVRSWINVDLKEYIDKYKPNVILFIYNPSSIYDDSFANFKWDGETVESISK